MYCTNCGEQLNGSEYYCSKCGNRISSENQRVNDLLEQVSPQKKPSSGQGLAGVALGLGIGALILPIPIVDVIMGIVAFVFVFASRETRNRGLWTAALVLAIVGTIGAVLYTLCELDILCTTPEFCNMLLWQF